jgi:type IV pilus assembly protein PilE
MPVMMERQPASAGGFKGKTGPACHVRGVTLIELMVAMAILAILASIAYPSYQAYLRRSNRADARTVLSENAQFLERNFTVANRYDQDSGGAAVVLPFTQSPKTGTAKFAISLTAATATTFVIQAAPTGGYADPECGTLSLSNTGAQTESGSWSVDDCWQR